MKTKEQIQDMLDKYTKDMNYYEELANDISLIDRKEQHESNRDYMMSKVKVLKWVLNE
jgi:hypothetical protein